MERNMLCVIQRATPACKVMVLLLSGAPLPDSFKTMLFCTYIHFYEVALSTTEVDQAGAQQDAGAEALVN